MKKFLFILSVFISSFVAAQTSQVSYQVASIAAMKAYPGIYVNRIHVVATNEDYVSCPSCTADEVTIYAGLPSGRKWKKVSDVSKAPLASPIFTTGITTPLIKVTSGSPGAGKVLTSDADGDATWETLASGVTDHTLLSNIGTNTHATIDLHLANTSNPHSVTKTQVGLSNVDNTSDATKNTAVATITNKDFTSATNTFPTALVTLTGSQTLTNKTLTSPVINTPTGIVKGDVGLSNVDNTSDVNKPVSTAQQTALNLKAALISPSFTTPSLGVASATTINKITFTTPATGSTFTLLDGKTFTVNNTLTLAGTDGSTLNIGTGGTLGTNAYTSTAYLPLAGGTLTGNLLATDNLYDLGASGATRFRTAYLGTSLVAPLISGGVNANEDITINGTSHATKTTSYVILQPNGGNVGIGTATPGANLHVNATAISGAESIVKLGVSDDANNYFMLKNASGTDALFIPEWSAYSEASSAYAATVYRASILAANDTGTEPLIRFVGQRSTPALLTSRHIFGISDYNSNLLFAVGATGRVGIGITSPTALLHIKAPTGSPSTGQLKLAVGTPPTTPEDGLMNYTSVKGLTFDVSTTIRGTVGLWAYKAITATYPITAQDYTLEATSGTFTATLPTAVGIDGRVYIITNSGAGVLTIATTSSQTFSNVVATPTTLTLAQFNTVTLQSNGTSWLRLTNL